MNITEFALKHTRVVITLLLVVVLAGLSAFLSIPRDEDPGYYVRTALVTTIFPGANPERVENLVTDKIEKIVQEMPEIDYINSDSRTGLSVIYVNISEDQKDLQPIWDKLRRKVAKAKADLPQNIYGPYVDDEFGDVFGTILTITGEGFSYREIKDVADEVRDELLRLKNVAKVEIYGAQQETVYLEYDNARLAKFGLSPYQLKNILQSRNILISGGNIKVGNERIVLEPSGNYEDFNEIGKTVIHLPNRKDVVYLGDIVEIKRTYADPASNIVHSSGTPALALGISLKDSGNIIDLGDEVKKSIEYIQTQYSHGIEFDIVSFQPQYVKHLTDGFMNNLIQSIIIVIALMLLFLGFRAGLLVATLIPVSILITFLFMSNTGITIDKVSLAALIISLGMLVDNAVVMSESIIVKLKEGLSHRAAILDSASELKKPLLIATLITSCAFLPIYLAESSAGEYCAALFTVVGITLLASWVLALTMVPMFCSIFLKNLGSPHQKINDENESGMYETPVYQKYRELLVFILKRPYKTLLTLFLVFLSAQFVFSFVPKIFFPDSDRAMFQVELKSPIGTSIERTQSVVKSVENYYKKELLVNDKNKKGITNWSSYIGKGAPRYVLSANPEPPSPHYAIMLVNTSSYKDVEDLIKKTQEFCVNHFPEVDAIVKKVPLGPPYDAPVEIRISGRNIDKIFELAQTVKAKLQTIEGASQIVDDWGAKTRKIVVDINTSKAHRAGVTNMDIAVSLQSAFSGFDISQYREGDKLIPISYRTTQNYRDDLGKIETLNVYSQMTGKSVLLKQVADIRPQWQYAEIKRRDRLRTVTIQAQVLDGYTADEVVSKLTPWLEKESQNWDFGYFWGVGGSVENSRDSNNSINVKLPIAGLIILILLMLQFNSFRNTGIVILAAPFALIGALYGLFFTKSYFGFITLLGVISLLGIITNNAVVLLDRIRIEKDLMPKDLPRAIVEAAQKRFRPILLTATTTVGGLMPLWISNDPIFAPMAIVIIFGLCSGAILTLGIVPVLYSLFYKINFKDFKY